jgi:predicted peptidase
MKARKSYYNRYKIKIVLFPIPEPVAGYKENLDLNYLLALIHHMEEKNQIDSGRIFMQGMSAGHAMTEGKTKFELKDRKQKRRIFICINKFMIQ